MRASLFTFPYDKLLLSIVNLSDRHVRVRVHSVFLIRIMSEYADN